MVRNPVEHLSSLHSFWLRKRPMLSVPTRFEDFLDHEFVVHDTSFGGSARYWFSKPIDYWVHFYYSHATLTGALYKLKVCQLEELRMFPGEKVHEIVKFAGIKANRPISPSSLDCHIGPGRDGSPPKKSNGARAATVVDDQTATQILSQVPALLLDFFGYVERS